MYIIPVCGCVVLSIHTEKQSWSVKNLTRLLVLRFTLFLVGVLRLLTTIGVRVFRIWNLLMRGIPMEELFAVFPACGCKPLFLLTTFARIWAERAFYARILELFALFIVVLLLTLLPSLITVSPFLDFCLYRLLFFFFQKIKLPPFFSKTKKTGIFVDVLVEFKLVVLAMIMNSVFSEEKRSENYILNYRIKVQTQKVITWLLIKPKWISNEIKH